LSVAAQRSLLVPEEADVLARVAALPVDLAAMAVAANVWRAAQAVRSHLERTVLREEGLSWAGFSLLFNLWVWGPSETRALAASMSCSRPTVTGLVATLETRGLVRRDGHASDGRLVVVSLTGAGRERIETVFPRFNAGEARVTRDLDDDEKATLAELLRRVVMTAKGDEGT
jgi:MarR family transcriptional regulator, organic hydroperoxide resistance regulator